MKTVPFVPLFFFTLLFFSACHKPEKNDLVNNEIYTLQLNDITNTEAILRLNCIMDRKKVYSIGFKWKKNSESNYHFASVSVNSGINTHIIKDLEEDTEYTVKAFMVLYSGDTLFGNDISFVTHGTMSDIDGNVYLTMRYGDKVWMTNNLRVTRFSDGTPIEARTGGLGVFSDGPVYYHSHSHSTDLKNPNYGLLYNWAAAVRAADGDTWITFPPNTYIQGICPNGWHIPDLSELYSITSRYRGSEMKTENWGAETTYASNNYSQFSAEPAGFLNYDGGWDEEYRMVGYGAFFWTIFQTDERIVFSYNLYSDYDELYMKEMFKIAGYSIRCVKD